jgi:hypothetical protein
MVALWPTPVADDTGLRRKRYAQGGTPLSLAVQMKWPTPTTQDNVQIRGVGKAKDHPNRGTTLGGAVRIWPTPTTSEAKSDTLNIQNRINKGKQIMLCHAVRMEPTQEMPTPQHGGSLNPTWVEWLMGWPLGWTDLKPLAMDKFRSWRQQLLTYSPPI